ncbi:PAS domain-containing sensor histidine kinase [Myxococcaceae bacterium GXIMD 01537]
MRSTPVRHLQKQVRQRAAHAERQVDRLRLVILAVGLFIAPWAWVGEDTNPRLAVALLAFAWVYELVLIFFIPPRPSLVRSHVTTTVDGLLSLGWIAATGGALSPAYGLLFIIAFATAIRYPPRLTWWASGLLAGGYLVTLALMNQLGAHLYASLIRVAVFLTGMYLGLEISRATQKRAEERAALEHQRLLEEAQRHARLGSYEWYLPEGRGIWSTEMYRVLGLDPGEVEPGLPPFMARVYPGDRAKVLLELQRLLRKGGTFDVEHRLVRPDGVVRWCRLRGEALGAGNGDAPTLLRGTAQDITEVKAAMETRMRLVEEQAARTAAEEALQVRDEFLSVAAHELKTPLTSLKLQIQAASRAEGGDTPEARASRARLERVERQASRLDQLIDNLLDVSRVARGRLDLERRTMDLSRHARESVERFAESAARDGTELRLVASGPVEGEWDPLRVDQLLDNLLSNALKYGAGRPIEVSVTREADAGRVAVVDHGISIPPEDRARIFERFERAVSTRHFGGLGLGLWVVREVVSALGGEVTVQATPGGGSTFIVLLPLHPPAQVPAARSAAQAASAVR